MCDGKNRETMSRCIKIVMLALAVCTCFLAKSAVGQGLVQGMVYEQDSLTPITGATVSFSGVSFSGDTLDYGFVADSLGFYDGSVDAGTYWVWATAEGYETEYLTDSLVVEEGAVILDLDFILHEVYHPVRYVAARQYGTDMVRVSWSMHEPLLFEDFETGDFSRFAWNNTISDHPWVIDSTHAYEGDYCMKSACEAVGNGQSQIEVSVYIPLSGTMSFYSKISSESPWDAGAFYLDGVRKMECTGETEWTEHEFEITEGEHLFRWVYAKDASTDMGDDCFYVDCIRFYEQDSASAMRSFQYYDLYRSRFEEEPVLLASHLSDTVFMEMGWNSLSWGKYRWGVSRYYEGNRACSDTVWSAYLDKDMTTTLTVDVTTNVNLPAAGAMVTLTPHDGQGQSYEGIADANGHLLLSQVYRDAYDLRVHLDGFVDYVADSALSVMMPTQVAVELMEATPCVDSLYVSSTGWAMWLLDDVQNRDLQYVEIMLNNELVDRVSSDCYQFDVSQLVEGETYTAKVRAVYLTGVCGWRVCEWVYQSCDHYQGSATGLQWSLHNDAVRLSWSYPEGETVLGAFLYRDGERLAFTEAASYVDATVDMHDDVTYCIRLVYDGAHDGTYYSMSCEECVVASFPAFCDPPMKLEGENFLDENGDYGALISWGERPAPVQQWLQYDDGTFKRALGGDNEPVIFWAIRFDADTLANYVGTALQKVALYDVGAGTYHLWIYEGGDDAPRTPVRSQNLTLSNLQAWHVAQVTPAFVIPEGEPIWIVVGQQGLSRPAAACADMGDPNGRWVSLDGEHWTDMHTFNMHYTWMLRAFVSNRLGQSLVLGEDGYALQHYNLYRSYDNVDYQLVASIPAVEGQQFYQYRDFLMGDEHHEFYYALTAVYLSDEGETCESDYAAALYEPEHNYVWIDDQWGLPDHSVAYLRLYPNPVQDKLWVESEGMQRYTVYNALGQRILTDNATAYAVDIDLSSCPNGIYLLKVEAGNVVLSRRFVVSH